jgi:putative transposase
MQESGLTHTLSFGLTITEGSPDNLLEANLESRRIRNEVNRLDRNNWDWNDIEDVVVDRADHVNNTTQQIIAKALGELERYHDHKNDDWGRPRTYIHEPYPTQMNHGEGYALTVDDGEVRFRISYKKYNYVRGVLRGSPGHLDRVQSALESDDWRVGTAELVHKHGEWRLHVTVTHETRTVPNPDTAETVVGVDINEDCIALAAMRTGEGVVDSVVFDYTDVKRKRHEFFTKRKRLQRAGQTAFDSIVESEERDFVHDQLHKVSRAVEEWVSQFSNPVIVFEDLEDMRDDLDYGTRMNRRLHSLPFARLRDFAAYKMAWEGVPVDDVDPEYTSQRCPREECGHTGRRNRRGKRFKCCECGWQDHCDRKAAVCVCQEWFKEQDRDVPPLNTLSAVEVRRVASGRGGAADPHGHGSCSGVTDAASARPETEARGNLNSAAPSG